MLYCTYDQYAAAGGAVPEAAFGVLCSRASRMIDAATREHVRDRKSVV